MQNYKKYFGTGESCLNFNSCFWQLAAWGTYKAAILKPLLLSSLVLIWVAMSTEAFAQKGSFAVRLSLKTFDCINKKMVVQVQVKANHPDSAFLMGDANYRFGYSTLQLGNPTIVSEENFSGESPANQSAYQSQNLEGSTAGSTAGIVSLNTIFAGRAGAKLVTTDWTTVSCLGFDLKTLTDCYTLTWQKDTDFPKTGMNEVIVETTSPFKYASKNVKSAKVFENLTACPTQLCSTGKFGTRLTLKSFDCQTKKAVFRVQVRAADANSIFLMGDANYRFNYSTALLGNPQIVSEENFSSTAPASDNRYTAQNLNGSAEANGTGIVSLNTKYSPAGTPTAKTVTVDWMTVSCISMDYKGSLTNPCFDLNLQTSANFPPTGMNEVKIDGTQFTLADLPAGVEFAKATLCPSTDCATKTADLSLTKKLTSSQIATVGSTATYRLVVKNAGPDTATNVVVVDSLPSSLQWLSSVPVLTPAGQVATWNIARIAPSDSAILILNAKILTEGTFTNKAQITKSDQKDPDSTPGNNITSEDDIADACVSVPVKICASEKVELSVPSSYTNVKWFLGTTQVGTGNVILVSDPGTYTVTADAGSCPKSGCCPIIVEASNTCCPVNLCVPVVIRKIRK